MGRVNPTTAGLADARYAAVGRWLSGAVPASVVAVCAEADAAASGGGTVVRLDGCLARLPAHRLVDLAVASGGTVVVALDACAAAADAGPAVATLAALTGGRVVARTEAPDPAPPTTLVDVAHPPVGRRHLFRAAPGADPAGQEDQDEQARLVAALRALGVGGQASAPAAALTVAGCIACGVCVQACPNDALVLVNAGGVSTLWHHAERCRGDGACVTHCPEHAVTPSGQLSWAIVLGGEPIQLARVSTRPCARCRAPITHDRPDGLCGPCSLRRVDPFGWDVPESLREGLPERWRRQLDGRPPGPR